MKKKKKTYHLKDFAIPVDPWVKIEESKKIDKYLDLARELKKLWIMRVMVIPIVVVVLRMVLKSLKKTLTEMEIKGRIETIKTTILLRLAKIQKRVLENRRNLLSLQ